MSVKQFQEAFLSHYYWHKDGSATPWLGDDTIYDGKITIQAAAGDFNVSNRTDALVEALTETKKVLIKLPVGIVAIELRFRAAGSTSDQHVLPVFLAAGVDHYDLVVALTIDQGTQLYVDPIYFCDTVVPATEKWLTDQTELSTTANNIGRYTMNVHGYDRIWIVASTLDKSGGSPNMENLYIDWKQL